MNEVIVVEVSNGSTTSYVIAKAWPVEHQYPTVMPSRYVEVARVRDTNDIGSVASAFNWKPEEA